MKTGNVILAIFLWLCIPASFVLGGIFGLFGGGIGGGIICALISPLVLFILGLVVLLAGIEGKSQINIRQTSVKDEYQTRRCPNCGRILGIDIKVCPYCSETKSNGQERDEALNILNQRYAKGEINKEEYEEIKKELKS